MSAMTPADPMDTYLKRTLAALHMACYQLVLVEATWGSDTQQPGAASLSVFRSMATETSDLAAEALASAMAVWARRLD